MRRPSRISIAVSGSNLGVGTAGEEDGGLDQASPRSSTVNLEDVPSDDLLRALAEVPHKQLALMDDGFVCLDSGLGATFSARMARRAAMQRRSRMSVCDASRGVSPNVSPRGSSARGSFLERSSSVGKHGIFVFPPTGKPGGNINTKDLFKRTFEKVAAPMRLQAAQKTTMNLMNQLTATEDLRRHSFHRTTLSMNDETNQNVEEEILPEHQLAEDPEFRVWAEEQLGLQDYRLTGLESSLKFRNKLGHQMMCWQALHVNKVTPPQLVKNIGSDFGDSDLESEDNKEDNKEDDSLSTMSTSIGLAQDASSAASDSRGPSRLSSSPSPGHSLPRQSPVSARSISAQSNPSPALHEATRSLFGLTRHLDAQSNRRAMTPSLLAYCTSDDHLSAQDGDAKSGHNTSADSIDIVTSREGMDEQIDRSVERDDCSISSSRRASNILARSILSGRKFERDDESTRMAQLVSKWSAKLPSLGQAREGAPGISLRCPPPFAEPHSNVASEDIGCTPEFTYLSHCKRAGLIPCSAVWRHFGEQGGIVDACKRSLTDADVEAIVESAVQCAAQGYAFEKLDLQDNMLTDQGLNHIAQCLAGSSIACERLKSLCLRGNCAIKFRSESAMGALTNALESLPALETFDISSVPLQGEPVVRLANCVRTRRSLKHLFLANCGLGRMDQRECVAVADLLGTTSGCNLESVDLSSNFFGRAGFAAAALALRDSKLRKLAFAGNGGSSRTTEKESDVHYHPIQLLIEGLLFNRSLYQLDLSYCGIGADSAFLLEDALVNHPLLKEIDLADNPLGDAGLRALMRLLAAISSDIKSCIITGHRDGEPSAHQVKFRIAQPGGIYCLNLQYPHERGILRTLLRISADQASSIGKTSDAEVACNTSYLQYFKFPPREPKPNVSQDSEFQRWVVPDTGTFKFTFKPPLSPSTFKYSERHRSKSSNDHAKPSSVQHRMEDGKDVDPALQSRHRCLALPGLAEKDNAAESPLLPSPFNSISPPIDRMPSSRFGRGTVGRPWPPVNEALVAPTTELVPILKSARVQVSALRYPIIRKMFLSLETEDEKLRFILACSKDLEFKTPQVNQLCDDRPELAVHLVCSLFPGIRARSPQLRLLNSVENASIGAVMKEVRPCIWLHEGNATGRYNLDLAKPADYCVAETCLIVNAWESEVARAQNRPDLSQRGNYEMLRNEVYNDTPFAYNRAWTLPSRGSLQFDFSTMRRPPPDTRSMTELNEMLKHLKGSPAGPEGKLRALRSISENLYLTTQQFKTICQCFSEPAQRQELFCCFHSHVLDPVRLLGPEFMHTKKFPLFHESDRQALITRLGHLQLLNPMRPEGLQFVCNLMVYEERSVLDFLVQLTQKEAGGKATGTGNKEKFRYISASWITHGVPAEDVVFTATYKTSKPNMAWRQALAEQYCGPQFKCDRNEDTPRRRPSTGFA